MKLSKCKEITTYTELKSMSKILEENYISVILDVVINEGPEGTKWALNLVGSVNSYT